MSRFTNYLSIEIPCGTYFSNQQESFFGNLPEDLPLNKDNKILLSTPSVFIESVEYKKWLDTSFFNEGVLSENSDHCYGGFHFFSEDINIENHPLQGQLLLHLVIEQCRNLTSNEILTIKQQILNLHPTGTLDVVRNNIIIEVYPEKSFNSQLFATCCKWKETQGISAREDIFSALINSVFC